MKVCLALVFLLGTALAAPSKRNIASMLDDLVDELGLKSLMPWFKQVISNDPDVDRVIDYFKGDSWNKIKKHLRGCPKYDEVYNNMLLEGVDIEEILEDIKRFVTSTGQRFKSRASLGDWFNELLEKMDIDQVLIVLKEKIKKDAEMQKIVSFFNGQVYLGIKKCMSESPDVKKLGQILKDEGIDIKKLVETMKAFFATFYYSSGHSRVRRNILDDVIKELGLKALLPWLKEKLNEEPDAQKVVDFFNSKDYDKVQDDVKDCPSYKEVDAKLKSHQINLDEIMLKIKDFVVSGGDTRFRRSLGDILEEFLTEKLDLDNIMEYIKNKESSDSKVQELLQFLRGDELKKLEVCLNEKHSVQTLIKTLLEEDIDVPRLLAMVKTLFGVA